MDQFSVTERTKLRDASGKVIGIVTTRANGDSVLRDLSNRFVGAYNRRTDETRDRTGKLVGKGNILAMLLREGFGSDSSRGRGGSRGGDDGGGSNDARDSEPAFSVAQRNFQQGRGGSEEPGRNPNTLARSNQGPKDAGRGMD